MPMPEQHTLLKRLLSAGLEAVRGDRLVEALGRPVGDCWPIRHAGRQLEWPLPKEGRLIVIGSGKAAGSLALGIERLLGQRIDDGIIIVKYGHRMPLKHIRQFEAGHPLPDEAGIAATAELLHTVSGLNEKDSVIMLLSGGASALMVAPADGITLAEKSITTDLLIRSGATIEEINLVRKRLSRIKGGQLLDHMAPASVLTLLLSDVPSGNHDAIGSGPTVASRGGPNDALAVLTRHNLLASLPEAVRKIVLSSPPPMHPRVPRRGRSEVVLLADSGTLVEAVRQEARRAGIQVRDIDVAMTGNTHAAARAMASALRYWPSQPRPVLLLAAGETTLQVSGDGKGGRNQEYALVAGLELEGVKGVALLAAGTDGTDGPTDAAGGFADGLLVARARDAGMDVAAMLARNDSYSLLDRTGYLLRTGPTGTNVMDLVLGLAF